MGFEDSFSTTFIGTIVLFLLFVFVILLVLWLVLPFSVFGIKRLIREAIEEQRRTNALLSEILKAMESLRKGPSDNP